MLARFNLRHAHRTDPLRVSRPSGFGWLSRPERVCDGTGHDRWALKGGVGARIHECMSPIEPGSLRSSTAASSRDRAAATGVQRCWNMTGHAMGL